MGQGIRAMAMNDKIIQFVVVVFTLMSFVSGGDVTAKNTSVPFVEVNTSVVLVWKVTVGTDQKVSNIRLFIVPNVTEPVMTGLVPSILPKWEHLYGKKLSATFNKARENNFIMTFKEIQYYENFTFRLRADFEKGLEPDGKSVADIHIKNVYDSPSLCGTNLKSKYTVNENGTLSVIQVLCGYPKPEVEWKVKDDKISKSYDSSEINPAIRQYKYTFIIQTINRTDCGKDINFTASNALGSQNGTAKIDVTFTPSQVSLKNRAYRNNLGCIYVMWYKQDTGECDIKYHLKFDENMFFYNITNTNFKLCNSTNEKRVTIWASYNGLKGKNVTYNISATPPPTTTTTTTTTSKTTSKTTNGAVITSGGDKSNIGLIVGIVGGILFVIIIIIIVVCVLKHKKKNGTGNHSGYAMRVTGEENNYVTDPTRSNERQPTNPDDPEQAIYSELGPGGGRTGPRPAPEQSDYAEMKVDAMGYPIDGAKASEPPTYAPIIKPREGAKRRTPSPPRSNVDGARAAASAEPPTYAPIIKNRSSSRGRSPPPDEDDHEGVIV